MNTLTPSTIARLNKLAKNLTDSTAIPDLVEACAFVATRVGLRQWASDNDAILYKGHGGLVNLWIDPLERVGFDNQVEWHFYPQFHKPDQVMA